MALNYCINLSACNGRAKYNNILTGGQLISSKAKVLIIRKKSLLLFSKVCYVPFFSWWHATSCKRTPPISGHLDEVPRVSAYRRFDCIPHPSKMKWKQAFVQLFSHFHGYIPLREFPILSAQLWDLTHQNSVLYLSLQILNGCCWHNFHCERPTGTLLVLHIHTKTAKEAGVMTNPISCRAQTYVEQCWWTKMKKKIKRYWKDIGDEAPKASGGNSNRGF